MRTAYILITALLLSACATLDDEINAQFKAYVGKLLTERYYDMAPFQNHGAGRKEILRLDN
jgi:starvation-inducible outer membrane lipoprotein